MRGKKYCILNKEYSEEEYKKISESIREELRQAGLYGQFLPKYLSPFGYNETIANDYFPLSKEEATERGFSWNDRTPGVSGKGTIKMEDLPDSIVDSDMLTPDVLLTCESCQKNYKLVSKELAFYRSITASACATNRSTIILADVRQSLKRHMLPSGWN